MAEFRGHSRTVKGPTCRSDRRRQQELEEGTWTTCTRPEGLDAIESASRDEIAALQLERMKWSLRHAYENSPFYRKRFDDARACIRTT